jgi:hypothetical protein
MTTTSSCRPRRLSISSSLHLPHISALALLSPVSPPPAARLALAAPLPSSRPASPLPPALTPPDCPSTHSVEVDAVLRAVSLVRPSTACSPCLSCYPPCSLAGPPTIPRADQLSACLDPNASPRFIARRPSRLPIRPWLAWLPAEQGTNTSRTPQIQRSLDEPSLLPRRTCTCRVKEPRRCSPA